MSKPRRTAMDELFNRLDTVDPELLAIVVALDAFMEPEEACDVAQAVYDNPDGAILWAASQ